MAVEPGRTTGPFAIKDQPEPDRRYAYWRRGGLAQARRRRARSDRARHRRRDRHRHLRHHRRGHRHRRARRDLLVHPGGRHVRVLGALLRRAGVVDPGLGQRVHVRLRDARRARGLDHRLGPDPRVRRVGGRGGRRLGRQPQRVPRQHVRLRAAGFDRDVARGRRHLQLAGGGDRARGDVPALARGARDREGQLHHGHRQAVGPGVLHRRGLQRSVQRRQSVAVRARGRRRGGDRGVGDLLRLYRLRRGLDRRRGGQRAQARSAAGHHRLAGDLHDHLHPRLDRGRRLARRGGAVGVRRPAGRRARRRRRHQLGGEPRGLRRAGRDHERADHDLLRPDPHLLRDGPRRPDLTPGGQGQPAHRARRSA